MDLKQEIKITLEEYLDLQEKAKNTGRVKVTSVVQYDSTCRYGVTGQTVEWTNAVGLWNYSVSKVKAVSDRLEFLNKERKKLASMSVLEFIQWRKEVQKERL